MFSFPLVRANTYGVHPNSQSMDGVAAQGIVSTASSVSTANSVGSSMDHRRTQTGLAAVFATERQHTCVLCVHCCDDDARERSLATSHQAAHMTKFR